MADAAGSGAAGVSYERGFWGWRGSAHGERVGGWRFGVEWGVGGVVGGGGDEAGEGEVGGKRVGG